MKMQELTFDEMVNTNGGAGLSGLINIKLTTTTNGTPQSTELNIGLGTVTDLLDGLNLGNLLGGLNLGSLNLGGLLGGL